MDPLPDGKDRRMWKSERFLTLPDNFRYKLQNLYCNYNSISTFHHCKHMVSVCISKTKMRRQAARQRQIDAHRTTINTVNDIAINTLAGLQFFRLRVLDKAPFSNEEPDGYD